MSSDLVSDTSSESDGMRPVKSPPPPRRRGGRLSRLVRKELREILRDRRTIFTLALMPLLVYPMLNLLFQRYLISSVSVDVIENPPVIGFQSPREAQEVLALVRQGWNMSHRRQPSASSADIGRGEGPRGEGGPRKNAPSPPNTPPTPPPTPFPDVEWKVRPDLEEALSSLEIDLAVRIMRLDAPVELELLHRPGSQNSQRAMDLIESSLNTLNLGIYRQLLRQRGLDPPPLTDTRRVSVQSASSGASMLGSLVPLILIMMTVTGAVYPAIDLTAGERERATLETLFAAPVSRFGLLLAKYAAVVTVALLTAVVNLTAMTATLYAGGMSQMIFGDQGLTVGVVAAVFCLLVLFAAFFSAVLLMITSSARSFKEAQAYLIPLMLVSLGPGLISLLPGLELTYWLAVTPLINVVLMARDLFQREPLGLPALLAFVSTAVYTLLAIGAASSVFGRDAVMQAQSGRGRRPLGEWTEPSPMLATGALIVLVPIYYLFGGGLAQISGVAISTKLMMAAGLTGLLFGVVPWLVCIWERVPLRTGLRLRQPHWSGYFPALILGLAAWPIAHQLVLWGQQLGIYTLETSQLERVRDMLTTWRASLSPQLLLVCLALAPALFEELFFRGFLFHAWMKPLGAVGVVVGSAVVFGAFHVISGQQLTPERFLPSTFLGLLLGVVAYRTGSVWPGVLVHFCNNGLLLMMAYYKDDLARAGFGLDERQTLPLSWLVASVGACGVAGVLLAKTVPSNKTAGGSDATKLETGNSTDGFPAP